MFDFDAGKLLIVGVIALIFIPPKDLPRVLRQAGQFVGKMRRMASEFQGQFMDAMREADMADLRQEARKLADAARVNVGLDAVADLKSHLTGAIEGKPMMLDQASTGAPMEDATLVDPNPELRRLVGGNGAAPPPEAPPLVDRGDDAGPTGGGRSVASRSETGGDGRVPHAPVTPAPATSAPTMTELETSEAASALPRSA